QDIRDVAVMRPVPGTVALYPLVKTGLPSDTLLALVNGACSDEKVRPLTDTVKVASPVKVTYRIEAAIRVYADADSAEVMAAVKQAAQRYMDKQAAQLGRDIVPSQIQATLSANGVYSVELKQPALQVVKENEWPWCENIDLNLAGVVND
ncbi:MAG: baseplate protein, partial [Candidatus Symbiopectobacterium sp. Dall1.0]|nr:baseplate protein [Candidatus Symbiopectobacterium sp. Dall1.0]